jgi:hypothetical protein
MLVRAANTGCIGKMSPPHARGANRLAKVFALLFGERANGNIAKYFAAHPLQTLTQPFG